MKGSININRFSNYREDDDKSISISFEDELSGARFLEVRMTPRDFAIALMGQGYVEVDFEFRADKVGMKRETKTETIRVSGYAPGDEEIKNIVTEYEVDGWMAHVDDFKNHHRYSRVNDQSYYHVGFTRYVER